MPTSVIIRGEGAGGRDVRVGPHRDVAVVGIEFIAIATRNLEGMIDLPSNAALVEAAGLTHEKAAAALAAFNAAVADRYAACTSSDPDAETYVNIAERLRHHGFFAADPAARLFLMAAFGNAMVSAIWAGWGELNSPDEAPYPIRYDKFRSAVADVMASLLPGGGA